MKRDMNFKDKKVLLLTVSFFNYEKIIAQRLRELGATVDFYDERPSNSILAKGIIRIKKDFYKTQINKYYQKILEEIKDNQYDYFLLIKGEVIPPFFIESIKKINKDIKTVYYNYDSFKNNPNAEHILHFFDEKFTFDRNDALSYNIHFRPLFYSKEYEEIRDYKNTVTYNTMFIGTAHSDRYVISEAVKKWCEMNNFSSFAFYFSPSRFVFLFKKLFESTFKEFDINKISFQSLKHSEIIDLYKSSQAILDINHPWQKGLTMRTFEALGAGRKLITTNSEIKYYPFYNAQNILIIDRENIKLSKLFFESDTVDIGQDSLYKMSLDSWLECLFFEHQDNYWFN
ncbi:hypothetical protein [Chryseobacterium oranimense]|nr:hypothetical protein [Chryseobacterium oranimense]